jgi:hypothetical protein
MAIQIKRLQSLGNSFVLFLFLGLLNCGNKKQRPPARVHQALPLNDEIKYPHDILEAGLTKQYDKVKWALYCLYAADTCRFLPARFVKDTVTFGELDLRFEKLRNSEDTVEMYFNFYYHDSLRCNFNLLKNAEYLRGAGFLHGSDSISYWISPTTMLYYRPARTLSKFKDPLRPEVIAYIKGNQNKLAAWLKNEAKNKKIIP